MRVLLDENLPHELATLLTGHVASTVGDQHWAGITNGELLSQADSQFDALLTMDRRLSQQQDLSRFRIRVVLVRAISNRMVDLRPLVPAILEGLSRAKPGTVTTVGA